MRIFGAPIIVLLLQTAVIAQRTSPVVFDKPYEQIAIGKGDSLILSLPFVKGNSYQVWVQQVGIDVMLVLQDEKKKTVLEQDSPNGTEGFELFDFTAPATKKYRLIIKRFEQEGSPEKGIVNYYIRKYTTKEIAEKEKTKIALASENKKHLLTLDIDHFWEAFDQLANCKTSWDSILTIQNVYFARATDGLKDFINARQWSPEAFVKTISRFPKYYSTVRPYTMKVKATEAAIEEVYNGFGKLYSGFRPFRACFVIGMHNTGGTVSDRFVLVGTEMMAAGNKVDYSELDPGWQRDTTQPDIDIPVAVRRLVAHECVHTQQPEKTDSTAVVCNQLFFSLREGAANFIGELISGNTNYSAVNTYGDAHESGLWEEFKSTLCMANASKWMYNGNTSKDRPADLGYYIGYKICQAYYNRMPDKRQAIKDIIEMNDPLLFLEKSGYDGVRKNK